MARWRGELWFGGARSANLARGSCRWTWPAARTAWATRSRSRAMDKDDIRNLRRWHRNAALRAKAAGSTSSMSTRRTAICWRISSTPRRTPAATNTAALENRTRLVRELIEETKEAVGDRCAVAVRFSADAEDRARMASPSGRAAGDVRHAGRDAGPVGHQHRRLLAGNGRLAFRQGRRAGTLHALGQVADDEAGGHRGPLHFARHDGALGEIRAHRPDRRGAPVDRRPLPAEEDRGRADSRTSANASAATSAIRATACRCRSAAPRTPRWARNGAAAGTPNGSPPRGSDAQVLVVGAGPAGLEAARALGARGYRVALAEATACWAAGWCARPPCRACANTSASATGAILQIAKMPNVEVFRESRLTAQDIRDFGADHVVIATGARWRRDLFTGKRFHPIADDGHGPGLHPRRHHGRPPARRPHVVYRRRRLLHGRRDRRTAARCGAGGDAGHPRRPVSAWAENTGEGWRVPGHLMGWASP
jgi:dimethylamine/trimethylamine dehydrogenase